jgi:hypothetical protein
LFFAGKDRERAIEHCHWLPSLLVRRSTGDGTILSPQSRLCNRDCLTNQPVASHLVWDARSSRRALVFESLGALTQKMDDLMSLARSLKAQNIVLTGERRSWDKAQYSAD